jgi:hypothetical protein
LSQGDLKKYLSRGTQKMPWTEMSQSDFLTYVVPNELMTNEQLLESSIVIMKSVVENPGTSLNILDASVGHRQWLCLSPRRLTGMDQFLF